MGSVGTSRRIIQPRQIRSEQADPGHGSSQTEIGSIDSTSCRVDCHYRIAKAVDILLRGRIVRMGEGALESGRAVLPCGVNVISSDAESPSVGLGMSARETWVLDRVEEAAVVVRPSTTRSAPSAPA